MANKKFAIASTLIILVLAYFLNPTTRKNEYPEFDIPDIGKEIYRFEIPDTLGPNILINSLVLVDSQYIYFSERSTASFYQLNIRNNAFKRVSRFGSGPGEYQLPEMIHHENDSLYVGDLNPFINVLDKEANHIREIKVKGCSQFIKHNDLYYHYSSEPSDYLLYTQDSKKYIKNPSFLKYAYPSAQRPAVFRIENTVYYMNNHENRIYLFDLDSLKKRDQFIELKQFPTIDWEKYYDVKMNSHEINQLAEGQHFFWHLSPIYIKSKLHFYLRVREPGEKRSSQFIINKHGTIQSCITDHSGLKYYMRYSNPKHTVFSVADEYKEIVTLVIYKIHL
jgi:hypothetical protein